MANEETNVTVQAVSRTSVPDVATVDGAGQFVRMAESLKPNYTNDQFSLARVPLEAAAINQSNAADICRGLGQFRVPDSGEMLARKWAEIPVDARHIFLRWKWDGKEKKQVVANCLVAAAGILPVDRESALDLLAHAILKAEGGEAEKAAVTWMRLSWLAPKRRSGALPLPLEQLAWPDLGGRWREAFFRLVTDTASGKHVTKNEPLLPQLRQTAARWLRGLASQGEPGGAAMIQPHLIRLDPLQVAVPVARTIPPETQQAREAEQRPPALTVSPSPQSEEPSPSLAAEISLTTKIPPTTLTSEAKPSIPPPPQPGPAESKKLVETKEPARQSPSTISGRGQATRRAGRFKQLLAAIQQVQIAVAGLEEDSEQESRQTTDDGGENRKLKKDLESARHRAELAEEAVETLRGDVRRAETIREDVNGQLARAADELQKTTNEIARLKQELESVGQQAAREQEQNRLHTDAEREEAVHSFARQLGEAMRHDVLNLKETEHRPPSEEQAKFLRSVVNGIVRRLRTAGVPLEGTDVRGQDESPRSTEAST